MGQIKILLLLTAIAVGVFLFVMNSIFVDSLICTAMLMVLLWFISLILKNSSIIDICWGASFVVMATYYFTIESETGHFDFKNVLFLSMVALWGFRLSIHLAVRNGIAREDFRYQEFRRQSKKNYWWVSLFRVFFLQGFLIWVLSSVFYVSYTGAGTRPEILYFLGFTLWLIGFLFESVGDWQLRQFKQDKANAGKVLRTGLWKYTRHPNYFGDALVWWGFYIYSFSFSNSWVFICIPVLMTLLLRYVSGVSLLESSLREKKQEYVSYIKSTPAFFPYIPVLSRCGSRKNGK